MVPNADGSSHNAQAAARWSNTVVKKLKGNPQTMGNAI